MKKNNTTNKVFLLIAGIIGIVFLIVVINNVGLIGSFGSEDSEIAGNVEITPNYFEYTPVTLASAQENGNVVLFFAATKWCNTCAALDKELKERGDELPENITILKIDYDNDGERKKQYEVVTQHTMILEDSDGNEIKRWIGGGIVTLIDQVT